MNKLAVPENIPLRWELWRGFGKSELILSIVIIGLVLAGTVLFCTISGQDIISTTVLAVVISGAACSGVFTKVDNNQSIFDFILRQIRFGREQQTFYYKRSKEVYELVYDKET